MLRDEPLLPEGMTIRDLHLDRPDAAPAVAETEAESFQANSNAA